MFKIIKLTSVRFAWYSNYNLTMCVTFWFRNFCVYSSSSWHECRRINFHIRFVCVCAIILQYTNVLICVPIKLKTSFRALQYISILNLNLISFSISILQVMISVSQCIYNFSFFRYAQDKEKLDSLSKKMTKQMILRVFVLLFQMAPILRYIDALR